MTTLSEHSPLTVPPVGRLVDYWEAENNGMLSRRALADASGPYEMALPAPIADLDLLIPADLAADIEEAASALAGFDQHARVRLGTASPSLGPMSAILLRTESTSSSQIENLTVSARQLALAEIAQSSSPNAKVVAGNVAAMEAALRLASHLDSDSILAMHLELMRGSDQAGKYRTELVWVGGTPVSPRGAAHIGPPHNLLPGVIDDLVAFMARNDLPVVAQAAIAHAQFETIHPFTDGNGRTGRALVHAMMRAKGLVTSTTAPVSAGLLINTGAYTDALTAYRAGDARPIIEQFATASRFAARSGADLVDDLAEQIDLARDKLGAVGLRPQAGAWRVLPALIAQPIINARYVQDALGMNQVGADRALQQLTDAGVLVERTGQRRNRVWQHVGMLTALDAYAASLRRS